MISPTEWIRELNKRIESRWRLAFFSCLVVGLLVHMPVLLSDIPNHDGLDSMYFDQNMITSGRWFLMIACGFSSYFTIPWLIGLLGLVYLSMGAAALCELLQVEEPWAVVACSGLLAAFPALTSTFAYVFTLDGYMLALLFSILAVLFTRKWRFGFLPGALCLAFSMGTYQAYLAFAMILSVFAVLMTAAEEGEWKTKLRVIFRYLYMGVLGAALYYGILQVLLAVQGRELANYQGIDGMVSGGVDMVAAIVNMYRDFLGFTFGGNVLFQNVFSGTACVLLALLVAIVTIFRAKAGKWWKNPLLFVIIIMALAATPVITNIILLISPNVTYHLLMRYQWVLYLIGAVAYLSNGGKSTALSDGAKTAAPNVGRYVPPVQWGALLAAFVLVFCYGVTDNIAYSNLQKKYEKTYAYCLRLLDRIEQTEGYYQGIPIAMIGVVGEEQFPGTDVTMSVTSNMIGMGGDTLLYTGDNYQAFMKHYLGATLNILPSEAMGEMYYSEEYISMDSFPGENSIKVMDGVMYIKTENTAR